MLDRAKDCIRIAATGAVTAAGFGLFDLDFGGTMLSHHEARALWVAQPYVVLGLALIGLAWLEYEGVRWARLIKGKAWVKSESTLLFVLGESEELIRIFHSSIQTAKRNAQLEARKPSAPVSYPSGEAGW